MSREEEERSCNHNLARPPVKAMTKVACRWFALALAASRPCILYEDWLGYNCRHIDNRRPRWRLGGNSILVAAVGEEHGDDNDGNGAAGDDAD